MDSGPLDSGHVDSGPVDAESPTTAGPGPTNDDAPIAAAPRTDTASTHTPTNPAAGADAEEASTPAGGAPGGASEPARQRKQVLLRLDPAVHQALQAWAASELRSVNAQVELLLRQALRDANRLPREVRPVPRRGRPPVDRDDA